jgi:Domain of unknown function (DUF4266)
MIRMFEMKLIVLAAALLPAFGCVNVQAYERGRLAHPTMVTSPIAGAGEEHMHAVQEGATGGDTGGGGGCGCN